MSDAEYFFAMVELRKEIAYACYDYSETHELLIGLAQVVDRGWWSGNYDVLEAVEKCSETFVSLTDDAYSNLVITSGLEEAKQILKVPIDNLITSIERLTNNSWKKAAETLPKWMTTPVEILEEEQTIRVEITKGEYEQILENRKIKGE